MKSFLDELKEHQTTLDSQQAQRLDGFSEQLTSLATDQTAVMDAIADLYEQISALQEQVAALTVDKTSNDSSVTSTTEGEGATKTATPDKGAA